MSLKIEYKKSIKGPIMLNYSVKTVKISVQEPYNGRDDRSGGPVGFFA